MIWDTVSFHTSGRPYWSPVQVASLKLVDLAGSERQQAAWGHLGRGAVGAGKHN